MVVVVVVAAGRRVVCREDVREEAGAMASASMRPTLFNKVCLSCGARAANQHVSFRYWEDEEGCGAVETSTLPRQNETCTSERETGRQSKDGFFLLT